MALPQYTLCSKVPIPRFDGLLGSVIDFSREHELQQAVLYIKNVFNNLFPSVPPKETRWNAILRPRVGVTVF